MEREIFETIVFTITQINLRTFSTLTFIVHNQSFIFIGYENEDFPNIDLSFCYCKSTRRKTYKETATESS